MLKVTKVWVNKYASGKMLGFADVQLSLDNSDQGHMTWRGFKLFQGRDGGVDISLPSRKDEKGEKDDKGRVKYHPVIQISKEEDGGPGNDLLEYIRSEIEKAYLSVNESKPTKTGSENNPGDDGVPF